MAPRRTAPATPRTTVTYLPTELITHIVELSTPAPSWSTFTLRSTHLRSLALVSRAFRGPAQEELFRHVLLADVAASRLFIAVIKSRTGSRFASTARSLRVGTASHNPFVHLGQEKLGIPFILRRCPRLEDAYLTRVDEMDLAELTAGTGATILHDGVG